MLFQQQVNTSPHFVKRASEKDILVHKFPCFCCFLDTQWSAFSAGKRLLEVRCWQWKNMTQTTLHFQYQYLLLLCGIGFLTLKLWSNYWTQQAFFLDSVFTAGSITKRSKPNPLIYLLRRRMPTKKLLMKRSTITDKHLLAPNSKVTKLLMTSRKKWVSKKELKRDYVVQFLVVLTLRFSIQWEASVETFYSLNSHNLK